MDPTALFSEPTVFEGSQHAVSSNLLLNKLPQTNVSLLPNAEYSTYYPVLAVKDEGNPLIFDIVGVPGRYININDNLLQINARVMLNDGKPIEASDLVAPTSLLFYSLFSSLEVYLNGTLITDFSNRYHIASYLRTHLSASPLEKEHDLLDVLYIPNTIAEDFKLEDSGFKIRYTLAKESAEFSMLGKVNAPIFNQGKFLPGESDIRLVFKRNRPELALDAASDERSGYNGVPFRVDITSATLFIKRQAISQAIVDKHRDYLKADKSLLYPVTEDVVSDFVIPSGVTSHNIENLITGKLPLSITFGLVSSTGYLGKLTKSFFNFQPFDLSQVCMTVNQDTVQFKILPLSFKTETSGSYNNYLLALQTLRRAAGNTLLGNGIDQKAYTNGNVLIYFEIIPTQPGALTINKNGSIKLSLQFKTALKESVTAVVLAQYQTIYEIDKTKEVTINR